MIFDVTQHLDKEGFERLAYEFLDITNIEFRFGLGASLKGKAGVANVSADLNFASGVWGCKEGKTYKHVEGKIGVDIKFGLKDIAEVVGGASVSVQNEIPENNRGYTEALYESSKVKPKPEDHIKAEVSPIGLGGTYSTSNFSEKKGTRVKVGIGGQAIVGAEIGVDVNEVVDSAAYAYSKFFSAVSDVAEEISDFLRE